MNNPTTDIEKAVTWAKEELEPYFQGEYGTMDTMLEMFLEKFEQSLLSIREKTLREKEDCSYDCSFCSDIKHKKLMKKVDNHIVKVKKAIKKYE